MLVPTQVYVLYVVVGVPALLHLYRQLREADRDALEAKNAMLLARRAELRLSFVTAAGTLGLMTCFVSGYSALTGFIAGADLTPANFAGQGYRIGLGSLWITACLGLFACFVGLYRSILQLQHDRGADPAGLGLSLGFHSSAFATRSAAMASRARSPIGPDAIVQAAPGQESQSVMVAIECGGDSAAAAEDAMEVAREKSVEAASRRSVAEIV